MLSGCVPEDPVFSASVVVSALESNDAAQQNDLARREIEDASAICRHPEHIFAAREAPANDGVSVFLQQDQISGMDCGDRFLLEQEHIAA